MPSPNRRNKFSKEEKAPKTRRTRVGEERPRNTRSTDKPFRRPEGDKPPYRGKSSEERPPRREEGEGRPPRGDKPRYGDKPAFGAKKPFKKKEFGDTPRGGKPAFGDKPPYQKKEWGKDREERDSGTRGGARKKDWGEKRSFGKSDDSRDSREERPSYRDKAPYGDKPRSGDKPYSDRPRSEDRPDRGDKPSGDKPFKKKEFGTRPARKPYGKREEDRDGKKSFSRPYDKARDKSENREEKREPVRKPFREKKSFASPTPASADGLIRLNKYIANAGVCSRREADKLIETGVISVNGKVVTELGFKVAPGDDINFGGQTLRKEKAVYVLLNKPKDYITTLDDPEGRKTVLELIKNATRERVYPVGRLDRNTTGLLLLTNDGELTKKLTHPRYGVKKIYQVTLNKALAKADMQKIADGFELEDGPVKADDISYVGDGKDKTEVGIQLHSGRNRIVRRIFEHLGYDVVKLDRVYFAGLTKKDLPRGRWRLLTALEISMLKMVPGE